MRRTLRNGPVGSLDLLLDTMCNAFGGVILIAILIVLLSSEAVESPLPGTNAPDKDSIERQIAAAQSTIHDLQSKLAETAADPLSTAATKLREDMEAARKALAEAGKAAEESAGTGYVDYSTSVIKLNSERERIQTRLASLENETKSLEDREASLENQIAATKKETEQMVAARTENVRLPKERRTDLRASPVIFLHNEVFWMYPDNRTPNTASIIWTPQSKDDAVKIQPIRGKGLSLPRDQQDVGLIISGLGSRRYIVCYVFPDSVDAFRKFRALAMQANVEIGWSLETSVDELIFSSGGQSPSPQ